MRISTLFFVIGGILLFAQQSTFNGGILDSTNNAGIISAAIFILIGLMVMPTESNLISRAGSGLNEGISGCIGKAFTLLFILTIVSFGFIACGLITP